MDDLEFKVRMLELAAKTYGGVGSVHLDAPGIANIAMNWYTGVESWKKPDTASLSGTLKVPKK